MLWATAAADFGGYFKSLKLTDVFELCLHVVKQQPVHPKAV